MKTNGCTYGADNACAAHARMERSGHREETEKYQQPGAVCHRRSFQAPTKQAEWTKHKGRAVKRNVQEMISALNVYASRKVPPCNARGVVVCKAK